MDENQEDVKQTEVLPEVDSSTTKETPTTTEDKPEEVNSTEGTNAVEESEVKESGKTANARIRELNAKLKESESKQQSMAEKMAELTGSIEPGQMPSYNPQVEPGAEITQDQYAADVGRQADAIVQLRLKQFQTLDRINRESQEAVQTHSKLNPNSDEFDKDLSEAVTEATLAYVRANPASSVKKFVDSLMKPYERSLGKSEGEAQAKLAKQVAEAALKPSQIKAEEKSFESLSISEMEKRLGGVQQS